MSPNATISRIALPGYHQSLLGNQGAILGSPLGNHLPIKFGKPCRLGSEGVKWIKIDTIDMAVKSRATRYHVISAPSHPRPVVSAPS